MTIMQLAQILPKEITKIISSISGGKEVTQVPVFVEKKIEVLKEVEKPVYI